MQFCTKCGTILVPKPDDVGRALKCASCGTMNNKKQNIVVKEKVKKDTLDTVQVVDKKIDAHPIIKEKCPKCENPNSYYWTMQTRAADEAETRFFECTKCHHRWRAYE